MKTKDKPKLTWEQQRARELREHAEKLMRAADILDPPKPRAGSSRKDK